MALNPIPSPFAPAFHWQMPQGVCVGVFLPQGTQVPPVVFQKLSEKETQFARALSPPRQKTWLGGRLALRAATGMDLSFDFLSNDRNAPCLPPGWVGSVSHKASLAVAWATPFHDGWQVGVDVEGLEAPRHDIAPRVLTEREREALLSLPKSEQARTLMFSFSAKEAIYKAIDPFVRRYVGFLEVELSSPTGPGVQARLNLPEGPFESEVSTREFGAFVVTFARVRKKT